MSSSYASMHAAKHCKINRGSSPRVAVATHPKSQVADVVPKFSLHLLPPLLSHSSSPSSSSSFHLPTFQLHQTKLARLYQIWNPLRRRDGVYTLPAGGEEVPKTSRSAGWQ